MQLEVENAERNRSALALPKEGKVGKFVLRMRATSFIQQSDATSAMVAERYGALRAYQVDVACTPYPVSGQIPCRQSYSILVCSAVPFFGKPGFPQKMSFIFGKQHQHVQMQ